MTLGGLALAVGILVDDATVEIENINRNLAEGKPAEQAILDGAQQIAVPAFVSTLCICIVFVPMFFLTGVGRYLFVPMAEAVVFAMLASYMLSRTLVPTMAKYLLRPHVGRSRGQPDEPESCSCGSSPRSKLALRAAARRLPRRPATRPSTHRALFRRRVPRLLPASFMGLGALGRRGLLPVRGQRPVQAARARRRPVMRIEETAALCDRVEDGDPSDDSGRPRSSASATTSACRTAASTSRTRTPRRSDRRMRTSWCPWRSVINRPTATSTTCGRARRARFRACTFSFLPGGHRHADPELRPAGADRRADRRDGTSKPTTVRRRCWRRGCAQVPGIVDLRVHQPFNQPTLLARRRPHARGRNRLHPARRRQQPADLAQRQQPDDADAVAEPGDGRHLSGRDADAAIQTSTRCRTSATSRSPACHDRSRRCSRRWRR